MTPLQLAKQKVASIFRILSFDPDCRWNELVCGGFEARTSLVSGHLCAHVGYDGEYRVWTEYSNDCSHTLCSGTFAEHIAMGMEAKAEEKKP